ncbi:alpha/beta hydrolase [Acidovorax sp.]|uniref:alpha/beta hydrolase n=1 Tax=Acidovorax sp. TaxID=1872122 RepID=UPI00391F3D67
MTTQDGTRLALWRVRDDAANPPVGTSDVFLTHGTFSDKRICLGMAKHLASLGCCCWILEWRGHGSSGASATAFNFDTVAQCDVMAALDHLGACRTLSVESENRPQRGQFLPNLQPHSRAMGQKGG